MGTKKRKGEGEGGSEGERILWPPLVIVENTRVSKAPDGRWTGLGNPEMACFLAGIGHTLGRPKSSWGKEGHRGQVIIEYPATLDGLKEAERLENHFKSCHRGREEWVRVKSMWHGLPGHEGLPEGPDLKRIDEDSLQEKRVLYGYLAKVSDVDKLPIKMKNKKCKSVTKKAVETMATSTDMLLSI